MNLADFQHEFAQAVLGDPVTHWRAQPTFAVYRNTVLKACIDALRANYPTVDQLVGPDWMDGATAAFVRAHPPSDARLVLYGEGFAEFLANFSPARALRYLPGIAQLDRCWTEAHIAPDAQPLGAADLARLGVEVIEQAVLTPHPAARWQWFDDRPVYSIWSRHREGSDLRAELDWHGEGALITRPQGAVRWQPASPGLCALLDACAARQALPHALHTALAAEPGAAPQTLLAGALSAGALCLDPATIGAPS